MPAINKKASLQKAPKPAIKKPGKPKLISSQLGVTAVKKPRTKHSFNPGKANRGIVFIQNIPHGFYEEQLKAYFAQFGQVTRTRVARSLRTGKSNGYAFVEFKVPEVGKIAAETMDNYLMFKQNLRTAYIPPEEQKFNYFREVVHTKKDADGVPHLVTPQTQRTEKAIKKINTMPTKKQHDNRVERALYKLKKAQEYYTNKNISIDLNQVAQNKPVESTGSAEKLGKRDQKKTKLAKKQASKVKSHETTLDRLLNETIPDGADESDESFKLNDEDNEAEDLTTMLAKQLKKKTNKLHSSDGDTTLERLLNETIPDGVDESDESFAPDDASESDEEEEALPVESSNKRKKTIDTSKAISKKSKSSVSSVDDIKPTVSAKSQKATIVGTVSQVSSVKLSRTHAKKAAKQSKPESSEDGDDEFTASTSSTAVSSATRNSVKSSVSSSKASPAKKIQKKSKKTIEAASSPKTAPTRKEKTSGLLAKGGVQKRTKKAATVAAQPETKQSKKHLLLAAAKMCKQVGTADLKKNKNNANKKVSR